MKPHRETEAQLAEIFSGIQGEGLYVGLRQIFVRFLGCDLHCRYCDSLDENYDARACAAEKTPGKRDSIRLPNPVGADVLVAHLEQMNHGFPHHAITWTGGEPLLAVRFLETVLPDLRARGFRHHLQTAGHQPNALERLIEWVDFVDMDIKLASATGEPTDWDAAAAFLRIASRKEVFVKAVFTIGTTQDELDRVARLVESISPQPVLVLQPVTPVPGGPPAPAPEEVLRVQGELIGRLREVRVIPQTHVILHQL